MNIAEELMRNRPIPVPKPSGIFVRATPKNKAKWKRMAENSGMTLTTWVTQKCNGNETMNLENNNIQEELYDKFWKTTERKVVSPKTVFNAGWNALADYLVNNGLLEHQDSPDQDTYEII